MRYNVMALSIAQALAAAAAMAGEPDSTANAHA